MDEAEKFVRDAMSFGGRSAANSFGILEVVKAAIRRKDRILRRLRNPGESSDPFSYAGAPVKPRPPRLKSAIRLPLP
jgi:hypothetical protein